MAPQLAAFFTTCVVEALGAALMAPLLRSAAPPRVSVRLAASVAAVLGSVATHPLVWWLNQHWALLGPWAFKVAVLEIGAALVEAIAYRLLLGVPWCQAVLASASMNALSFGLGLVFYAVGGLPT